MRIDHYTLYHIQLWVYSSFSDKEGISIYTSLFNGNICTHSWTSREISVYFIWHIAEGEHSLIRAFKTVSVLGPGLWMAQYVTECILQCFYYWDPPTNNMVSTGPIHIFYIPPLSNERLFPLHSMCFWFINAKLLRPRIRVLEPAQNKCTGNTTDLQAWTRIHWRCFHHNSNAMEISVCDPKSSKITATKFWHMTRQLCCRGICKIVVIWWPKTELHENDISIGFELWVKKKF